MCIHCHLKLALLVKGSVWPCFSLPPGCHFPPVHHPLHQPLASLSIIKTSRTFQPAPLGKIKGIEARGSRFGCWGLLHSCPIHIPPDLSSWQHLGHILAAIWIPNLRTPSGLPCGGTNPTPPAGPAPDSLLPDQASRARNQARGTSQGPARPDPAQVCCSLTGPHSPTP